MKKYDELIADGWIDSNQKFSDLAILKKDKNYILFDIAKDVIFLAY